MLYFSYQLKSKTHSPRYHSRRLSHYDEFSNEDYLDSNLIEDMNTQFYNSYAVNEDKLLFITEKKEGIISIYAAMNANLCTKEELDSTVESSFEEYTIITSRESTVDEFKSNLEMSSFCNGRKVLSKLKLDYRIAGIFDPCPYNWEEQVLDLPPVNEKDCLKRAGQILASQSFTDELARIYSPKNKKAYYGHPVHYMISAGDWGAAQDMYELLIRALGSNGRLRSNRVSVYRDFKKGAYRDERYRQHMYASRDGIVVIELCCDAGMSRYASDFHEFAKVTGQLLEEMKKDTLFIFVEIMGKSVKNPDAVSGIVSKADIIQLTEGSGTYEQAAAYLTELVDKSDIKPETMDEALSCLPQRESYTVTDIFNAYNNWYGSGLKNHIYKAYKKEDCCKVEITKAENKPYDDLQRLIGLTDAKQVIGRIISAGKVRCLRENMGLKTEAGSLNMLFAGSPGTAKTTVARLLAQILKEEDIIKSGKLVECGRQDLVARYVGWTAKTIEEKFREADGGVLFIDEAYSLVDSSDSFGTEAINTITQLMENYRERVIVIFAGYPDKMKKFLEQNEGLMSRIAFHLNFPDYTAGELLEILKLHAEKREYTLTDSSLDTCSEIFENARCQENFGNGRYVRNLLEQAIIRQSSRLMKNTSGELTPKELCELRAEDFDEVVLGIKGSGEIKLGFAV